MAAVAGGRVRRHLFAMAWPKMTQATARPAVNDHGEFIPNPAGRSHIHTEPLPRSNRPILYGNWLRLEPAHFKTDYGTSHGQARSSFESGIDDANFFLF